MSWGNATEERRCMLKTVDGRVAYRYSSDNIQVRDTQEDKCVVVQMYCKSNNTVCMAFKITNDYIFVDGNTGALKVKKWDTQDSMDNYLFKWGNESGDARSLVSVAKSQCLTLSSNWTIRASPTPTPTPLLFKLEGHTK